MHIQRCIESIRSQTYSNLEIIIVNDGSTDSTAKICEEYEVLDPRIRVFHTENRGVSPTRNFGIEKAKGYYIQFVDSDDYLAVSATQLLVENMVNKKVDLVVCGYTRLLRELKLYRNQLDRVGKYSNKQYLANTLKDPGHHYYGVIWNKLYKTSIIRENKLQFIEDVKLGEDFIFNIQYLKYISYISVIGNRLYFYNCENENTLSRYEKNIITCISELNNRHLIFEQYKKTFCDMGLYEEYQYKIQRYWLMYLIRNINYVNHEFKRWNQEDLETWKKILFNDQEIVKCINYHSSFEINFLLKWIFIRGFVIKKVKAFINKVKRI